MQKRLDSSNSFVYAVSQVIKNLYIFTFLPWFEKQAVKEASTKEADAKEQADKEAAEKVRLVL